MDVSREMTKVAFEVIKAKAKRKAQGDLDNIGGGQSRLKQRRTEDLQSSMHSGQSTGPSIEVGEGHSRSVDVHTRVNDPPFLPFPANFSWDDWGQWLNDAAL